MLNWLRTKLKKWLGIEELCEEFGRCRQAWWDSDVERGNREEQFRKDLSAAVGREGKSLAKQIQELSEIDGNQPAGREIPNNTWQKTKLGGAIYSLRLRVSHLENPPDKRPGILGLPNGSVVGKKKRAKVKKRR